MYSSHFYVSLVDMVVWDDSTATTASKMFGIDARLYKIAIALSTPEAQQQLAELAMRKLASNPSWD